MEFTLLELNELIYCVGTATKTGTMVNKKVANKLWAQLSDELDRRMKLYDLADNGPEYDSAGFTDDDRIVNGQYNVIKDPIGGGE